MSWLGSYSARCVQLLQLFVRAVECFVIAVLLIVVIVAFLNETGSRRVTIAVVIRV